MAANSVKSMTMKDLDPEILRLARTCRGPYLAALSAAYDKRAALLAVLAFHAEIARIPAVVSEPILGRMRLQWWVDVLPGMAESNAHANPNGQARSHPVALALAPLGLAPETLCALANARNFDLDEGSAAVNQHIEQAAATGGVLFGLLLDVLGVVDDETRTAARKIGVAWALTQTLSQGRRVASDADADALRAHARAQIQKARNQDLPKAARKAALPVLVLARLVERSLKNPQDPLGAGAVFSVWWGNVRGRF